MKNNKKDAELNKKLQKSFYKEMNDKIDIILGDFFETNKLTTIK
jgi:hypothetical protein